MIDTVSPSEPPQSESPDLEQLASIAGERLAEARKEQKIDLRDAARQLRLTTTALMDIERGDLKKIGASVYARGYFRSYAALLGEDVSELLTALDQPRAVAPEMPNLMISRPRFAAFDRYIRAATYVAGTSLLVVPIYWFIDSGGIGGLGEVAERQERAIEVQSMDSREMPAGLRDSEPTMATMAPFRTGGAAPTTDTIGVEDLASRSALVPIPGITDRAETTEVEPPRLRSKSDEGSTP